MKIKDLKLKDFFTLKSIEEPSENQVYVRGPYDRTTKKYLCWKYGDVCCERLFKGDKEVYTEFTF